MPSHHLPTSLAVIGAGNMGAALVRAWNDTAHLIGVEELYAIDPNPAARESLRDTMAVCHEDLSALPHAECIVLAVKPQIITSVLETLAQWIASHCAPDGEETLPIVISIAAGVSTHTIEAALPSSVAVIRTMPNLALGVGQACTALCKGAAAAADDLLLAQTLFDRVGKTVLVDEVQMDAVCAVSGSGAAYCAYLVEAMAHAGAKIGLACELAEQLATQTLIGTAALLQERAMQPKALREAVTSPQGTTEAAIKTLDKGNFTSLIEAAVESAYERSIELGQASS